MISIVSCHCQCFDNGQLSLPCLLKKKKKRKKKAVDHFWLIKTATAVLYNVDFSICAYS